MHCRFVATALPFLVALVAATAAAADPPTAEASLGVTRFGPTVTAAASHHRGSLALGLSVDARRGLWFPGGVPTERVTAVDVRAHVERVIAGDAERSLVVGVAAGLRALAAPAATSVGVGTELSAELRAWLGPRTRLRVGVAGPFALVAGEVDQLEQRYQLGLDLALGDGLALTVDVAAVGAYGYDGDGAKFDARALVGVRLGALGRRPPARRRGGSAAYLALEWRALAVADHASHGPGFVVGATVLGGHLRVGLAGWNRPGPINPRTFATRPVEGQTWNGQATLALRSDGNFVGLHVAPVVRLGAVELSAPITVGQAAFGFYLHGADRDAVMGERVSAVENRLFAGRDSSFALGAELGVHAAVAVTDWVAPYASLHYLTTVGYDTLVRDDYGGVSVALGAQFTP